MLSTIRNKIDTKPEKPENMKIFSEIISENEESETGKKISRIYAHSADKTAHKSLPQMQ